MPTPETVQSRLDYLLPGSGTNSSLPSWPPDVFCLCASILHGSGAYSRVVDDYDPASTDSLSEQRAKRLCDLGAGWQEALSSGQQTPDEIQQLWDEVIRRNQTLLSLLSQPLARECRDALCDLLAISDEACAGAGFGQDASVFLAEVDELLVHTMFGTEARPRTIGATLCKDIDASRARVLPKVHTPQSGLTIRSVSHHLAFLPGMDTRPFWYSAKSEARTHARNLLLIPWPRQVHPSQFKVSRARDISDRVGVAGYGLFTVRLSPGPNPDEVKGLVQEAQNQVGHIDGIIFPELSMSETEFNRLSESVVSPDRFLVAGVGEAAEGGMPGKNKAIMDLVPTSKRDAEGDYFRARIEQTKHHRWKLDKRQIAQYGIGANLHPEANWWEHIELGNREITFVTFAEWLTVSLLICEDLARPDPVGDVLRAVGPNLILALLSDGPQIESRWPGRYASGFADDPGSSVLTLTNLGMSKLARPSDPSRDRSGVIALWRDAKTGATEIRCPESAAGVVLSVTAEYHREWTADGRIEIKSGYPVLSGSHPIELVKGR